MRQTFADPKTDFVFRRTFGNEAGKPLLIALLNHLLELKEAHRILDVKHLGFAQRVVVPELRLSLVDVRCTNASGHEFVVKIQVLKVEGFERRVAYSASRACTLRLQEGEEDLVRCDMVGITLSNFMLWPEQDATGQYSVPMLSRWRMPGPYGGVEDCSSVQHVFLELPKYAGGDNPQTMVDRWAYLFREAKNLNVVPAPLAEAPFRDALAVARTATFKPLEWEAYEREKMAEQDAQGALAVARSEGVIEGMAESLLALLKARVINVDEETHARIVGCTDAALLEWWVIRATTARSAEEFVAAILGLRED